MYTYQYPISSSELYHYGILGMKWGVRRYQNYDGSYTQAGMKRYNKAKSDYETAKEAYKNGTGTKSEVKSTKKAMKKAYSKLADDKRADQGKELYKKGKTITNNTRTDLLAQTAVVAGATITQQVMKTFASEKVANISSTAIGVGGTAVNALLWAKTSSDNKKLRAYYSH